jgi:hypothetical protein
MQRARIFLRAVLVVGIISLLLLPLAAFSTSAQQNDRIELAVDTANFNQDGLLVLFGGLRLQGQIGLPVGAGDLNGDGRAEVIFCGMYGSAGAGSRDNNGQVNFYVSDGRDSGFVDQFAAPPNISTLVGADSGDLLGTSVSANGDVNGDGLRDVAIGAMGDDGPGNSRFNAGAAYVVLGSANFNMHADLRTGTGVPPPGIIAIYGPQVTGRVGIWIDLGDVDGDGFADVVVGSDQIDSDAGQHVGGAYIIFGSATLPQVIDLAAPPAGVRTARILGAMREEHWGAALHIGDINNDGVGDVVIAGSIFRDSASYVTPQDQTSGHDARGASFGGRRVGCGEAYVVYGSHNWPATVDLRNPPANSTHVIGANPTDLLGSQLHSGDLNGDGRTDLIVGALQALAPDNRGRTGAVYVIYGSPGIQGATIDLANPDASGLRVTTVYGEHALDCAGDSTRAFDINKDGMSDLFVGSPEKTFVINGEEREDAGDTNLIFGQRDFLPAVIKLYDPPASPRIYRLAGAHGDEQGLDGGDEFSYRLTGADVDGDGYVDYVANAMHGDGLNNRVVNAGNVYVFSGKKVSAKLGKLNAEPDPTPVPAITSARLTLNGQTVQQAAAGQPGLRVIIGGTNLRADTEVTINGVIVVAHLQNNSTEIAIDLDENPAIRNSAGALVVRARNLSPAPSAFSNEVTAGRLTGPEITSIRVRRKSSGLLKVDITGANFTQSSFVVIIANGQPVEIKSTNIESSTEIGLKIKAGKAPPPGATLRVRVVSPTGVQSNEVTATAP